MSLDVQPAIGRAVAFLKQAQLASGEIPALISTDPEMLEGCTLDPCIFPTALAAHALGFAPEAAAIQGRALDFLEAQIGPNGLWKHWPQSHPQAASLPADADDTSCATAVLAAAGRPVPDNRPLLLANRDRSGRFFTWFVPRLSLPLLRATSPMLFRLPSLVLFFRLTSAKPGDVDAAVNANSLYRLGAFEGRDEVEAWLLDTLGDGAEAQCDKWYENPFVVRYFFARAIGGLAEARTLLVARTRADSPATMLDHALAAATLAACSADPRPHVEALLAGQAEDGSWPRAAIYHGGRKRLRSGGFEPPHPDTPRWGSEAMTTSIAVEALARARAAT
jgi:hypothetical protein